MKVLIVDDNAPMRRLIRRLALSPIANCFECADGAAALVAYEQHQLGSSDWVVMDVEMAGMNGLTATQRLRACHPEARVVIVTRHNDEELRTAAFRHGAYGFIPKENILALRTLLNATA